VDSYVVVCAMQIVCLGFLEGEGEGELDPRVRVSHACFNSETEVGDKHPLTMPFQPWPTFQWLEFYLLL
jgi:hypothetical protein